MRVFYAPWVKWERKENRYRRWLRQRQWESKQKVLLSKKRQALTKEAFDRAEENRESPTPAEAFFKNLLKANSIKYFAEYVIFYKNFTYRIVDFFLPEYRVNIEIDGAYHNQLKIAEYDFYKDKHTKTKTWRFKNETIFSKDFETRFKELLRKRDLRGFKGYKVQELKAMGVL